MKEKKPKVEKVKPEKKPTWKQMVEQRLWALENYQAIAGPAGPEGVRGPIGETGKPGAKGDKGGGFFGY